MATPNPGEGKPEEIADISGIVAEGLAIIAERDTVERPFDDPSSTSPQEPGQSPHP